MLKYCAIFSLCAGLSLAGDFVTGQAARLVIGQTTFTQQDPPPNCGNTNGCASATLLGGVGGIAYANNTLFITDANRPGLTPINNRVLIYQNLSKKLPGPSDPLPVFTGIRCPVCGGAADVVLGQPDMTQTNIALTQNGMRLPTAVASDGRYVAVADTGNNRVLIWNSIPTTNGQPADVVVGQQDFTTLKPVVVDATSIRAPQGVWIQNGKLFVADTINNRVLIWNSIPTTNNKPADVVLGQANFTTVPQLDLTKKSLDAAPNTMYNPVAVTTDGIRLFVTDLGHNRILIWNSIPTTNQAPADVEIGQMDFNSATANDASNLCASNGTDTNGNPTYPNRCDRTLDTPRFALSDGTRLFVADGGNDRILVFDSIPTVNAATPDQILGQTNGTASAVTTTDPSDFFHPNLARAAANVIPTPMSLAWDGTNLYATDPTSRRVLVFTPLFNKLNGAVPINGVRNAASLDIYAYGAYSIVVTTIQTDDQITLTINSANYVYKIVKDDTVDTITTNLTNLINANGGDPNVIATSQLGTGVIVLRARQSGADGNNITISSTTSTNAMVTVTASGSTLQGGEDATTLAPGTLVTIFGTNLSEVTASADMTKPTLPVDLGGVQVYFDGLRSPLTFVSPTQINAQIPFETADSNSTSTFVRTTHSDGSVTVTSAIGVPLAPQNPGVFAEQNGSDVRPAIAYHSSSYATGTISFDGTVTAGDTGTITIEDRSYSYTFQATDTTSSVRDAFITLINANPNERVVASAAGAFSRMRLRAKVAGPDGNGIPFSATSSTNATISIDPTAPALCCANVAGARITQDNPALPGETITVLATGLGIVTPEDAKNATVTGAVYLGPAANDPNEFVSSLVGGSTANVINAGLKVGAIGIYQVDLELNSSLLPTSAAPLTIAQNIYISNVVTIPIGNPEGPSPLTPSQ